MNIKCPHCGGKGRFLSNGNRYVAQDGEMLQGKCYDCKKQFNVSLIITCDEEWMDKIE